MAKILPLVLVVEDDEDIRRITRVALMAGQYRMIEAGTGQKGLEETTARNPDLILLDLGLPDMSGLDVIRGISGPQMPPIVIFSAGSHQREIIAAIDEGAVDYVAKPFMFGELLSRLESALRGSRDVRFESPTHFFLGEIEIDLRKEYVTIANQELSLTSREMKLFATMVKNPGRLLTYQFLNQEIFNQNDSSNFSELVTVLTQLRHKLEPDSLHPQYLQAEIGIGYRFRYDGRSSK